MVTRENKRNGQRDKERDRVGELHAFVSGRSPYDDNDERGISQSILARRNIVKFSKLQLITRPDKTRIFWPVPIIQPFTREFMLSNLIHSIIYRNLKLG